MPCHWVHYLKIVSCVLTCIVSDEKSATILCSSVSDPPVSSGSSEKREQVLHISCMHTEFLRGVCWREYLSCLSISEESADGNICPAWVSLRFFKMCFHVFTSFWKQLTVKSSNGLYPKASLAYSFPFLLGLPSLRSPLPWISQEILPTAPRRSSVFLFVPWCVCGRLG